MWSGESVGKRSSLDYWSSSIIAVRSRSSRYAKAFGFQLPKATSAEGREYRRELQESSAKAIGVMFLLLPFGALLSKTIEYINTPDLDWAHKRSEEKLDKRVKNWSHGTGLIISHHPTEIFYLIHFSHMSCTHARDHHDVMHTRTRMRCITHKHVARVTKSQPNFCLTKVGRCNSTALRDPRRKRCPGWLRSSSAWATSWEERSHPGHLLLHLGGSRSAVYLPTSCGQSNLVSLDTYRLTSLPRKLSCGVLFPNQTQTESIKNQIQPRRNHMTA